MLLSALAYNFWFEHTRRSDQRLARELLYFSYIAATWREQLRAESVLKSLPHLWVHVITIRTESSLHHHHNHHRPKITACRPPRRHPGAAARLSETIGWNTCKVAIAGSDQLLPCLSSVVAAWRWLELLPAGGWRREEAAGRPGRSLPSNLGRVAPVVQTDTRPSSRAPPGEAAAPECGMCPVLLLLLLPLLSLLLLLHLLLLLLPEFLAALTHTRALHSQNCVIEPLGQGADIQNLLDVS